MENTQMDLPTADQTQTPARTTIALALIVHGEAVRYNRGQTGKSRYDFKHMVGPKGVVPYVSSQCFKKHWRETLPFVPSPIIREKDSKGQEKNQAFTSGDPMKYVDDDLFGYMIAGAAEAEQEGAEAEEADSIEAPEDQDNKLESISFSPDQLKGDKTWIKLLKDETNTLAQKIVKVLPPEVREELNSMTDSMNLSPTLREAITGVLNGLLAITSTTDIFDATHFPDLGRKAGQKQADALKVKNEETVRMTRLELLQKALSKGFEVKKKRDTTRRTAPIRMHALVAFSGIQIAEDFQTFSRDVALTGKNSVLNPHPVGIYSGWLKTRVLIEAFRVGKFYIGGNMDILEDQKGEYSEQEEPNPYDRQNASVRFIEITPEQRRERVSTALQFLGDIGNERGPASSALHDGSLKPRAFIGAFMNCADSPFDSVWEDNGGTPRLNLSRLKAVLRDWDDLFQSRVLYIGIAPEMLGENSVEEFSTSINETLELIGFTASVDTPRRALKKMAENVSI